MTGRQQLLPGKDSRRIAPNFIRSLVPHLESYKLEAFPVTIWNHPGIIDVSSPYMSCSPECGGKSRWSLDGVKPTLFCLYMFISLADCLVLHVVL